MPIGDRIRHRRHPRRLIRPGDTYIIVELERGEVELEQVPPRPEPPVEVQGEPWGWTKDGPRPKGWPGPDANRDDPGPYDGAWEPGEARR
jgi:hypothetical protein